MCLVRLVAIALSLGLAAQGAPAQEAALPGSPESVLAMITSLPPEVRDDLLSGPKGFVARFRTVILGFGGPDGIGGPAIDLYIDAVRAQARNDVRSGLLDADLDNDGDILLSEVERLCPVVSAYQRAALREAFQQADADGDATVTEAEIALEAEVQARNRIDASDEMVLRSLVRFDLDGNGLVSMGEVERIAEVARASAAKAARKSAKGKPSDT
jgi:Ca2+-binding EF-hand superfamily protein